MKKIFTLIIAISIAFIGFAQNKVVVKHNFKVLNTNVKSTQGTFTSNLDFENWSSDVQSYGFGLHPEGMAMITGDPNGQQTTDANSGTYALHCQSDTTTNAFWTNDTLVGGFAFTGSLTGDWGEDFTTNVDTCKGYIKGELLGNDTAFIIVQLRNADSILAVGIIAFGPGDVTTTYTPFSFPITSTGPSTLAHDSIDIIISSTGVGLFNGVDIGTLTAGSYIDIDNMELTGPVNVESIEAIKETEIYPNPTNGVSNIKYNIESTQNVSVKVFDITGKTIFSNESTQSAGSHIVPVDFSSYPAGTYFYTITTNDSKITSKITVIK